MGINRSKIARQLLQYGGSASGRTGFEGSPEMGGRGTTETYGFDQSDSSDNVRAERRKEIAKGLGKTAIDVAAQMAFPPYGMFRTAQAGRDALVRLGLVDPNAKFKGPVPTTESDSISVMPLVSPAVGIASQMDEKPSELAEYIASIRAAQPNPFMLDPRFAAADGGRVAFGLGSLVKKITKPIKKLVKSDVGKAALLAAGAYGLSRPGAMGTIGTKLGGLKDYIVGKQAMDYGEVASKGLLQRLGLTKTPGKFDLTKRGIAAAIGIPSLLGYFATPDEEDEETLEQAIARTYGTDRGIDIPGIRRAALGYSDPNELYFKLPQAFRLGAAEGGRIGYANGGYSQDIIDEYKANVKEGYKGSLRKYILEFYGPEYLKPMAEGGSIDDEYFARKDKELERLIEEGMSLEEALQKVFPGTKSSVEFTREELGLKPLPEGKAEGGIMDLGGKEMDLRGGGFVPIGAKEKADDVPARLSKNEFVFTADAVRGAGGGSVEKGAQKMYNTMKQLEEMV